MEKKRYVVFFIAMITLLFYIAMSSAVKHTAIDEANLRQWRMDTALTRRGR